MRHRHLLNVLARRRSERGVPDAGAALVGTLYAGDDQIILGGGQETINLSATYTGDPDTSGITFTWSQTAGGAGTFGDVNSLSTTFTTETNVDSDISLLITAVRGAFTLTDGLDVTVNPVENISAIKVAFSPQLTDLTYYVESELVINPDIEGLNVPYDTILWQVPSETSTPTYTGYQIKNVTTGQIVESGTRATDDGRFTIPNTDQYQYCPVFETGTGRQVIGTSDGPFVKREAEGTLVEILDNVITLSGFTGSDTINRNVSTRGILEPSENFGRETITSKISSDNVFRVSFTSLENDVGVDSARTENVKVDAFQDSDNVFRLAYTLATLPV